MLDVSYYCALLVAVLLRPSFHLSHPPCPSACKAVRPCQGLSLCLASTLITTPFPYPYIPCSCGPRRVVLLEGAGVHTRSPVMHLAPFSTELPSLASCISQRCAVIHPVMLLPPPRSSPQSYSSPPLPRIAASTLEELPTTESVTPGIGCHSPPSGVTTVIRRRRVARRN